MQGEFREAISQYEALVASQYDPRKHVDRRFLGGVEVGSIARGMIGYLSWFLGFPDRALEGCRKGVDFARQLESPQSAPFVAFYRAGVHHLRRDVENTEAWTEELQSAAAEAGVLPLWEDWLLVYRGRSQVQRGEVVEGIAAIRTGRDTALSKGFKLAYAYWSFLLADGLRVLGRAEEGLEVLEDAPSQAPTVDELFYASETHRTRGELLLALPKPKPEEAEAAFRHAIEIARSQEAKSYELRATTSLARLLRDTGRADEARSMLGEIYGWFTEGLDTADLKDAKALLEELEPGAQRGAPP
jgi:tetratricopeptide (TPR) repeat protein